MLKEYQMKFDKEIQYIYKIKIDKVGYYIIRKHCNYWQICFYNKDTLYSIYEYTKLGNASKKLLEISRSFADMYKKYYFTCHKENIQRCYLDSVNDI